MGCESSRSGKGASLRYESYKGEVDVNKMKQNGVRIKDHDQKQEYRLIGIEFSEEMLDALVGYFDLNYLSVSPNIKERNNLDGFEIGAGLKSRQARQPGWDLDWNARVNMHLADGQKNTSSGRFKEETYGVGADLSLGPAYNIEIRKSSFVSPHAGLSFKGRFDDYTAELNGGEYIDAEHRVYSGFFYIGIDFTSDIRIMLDRKFMMSVNYYIGFNRLNALLFNIGIKF